MKKILLLVAIFSSANMAWADIESRANAVHVSVEGKHNYHAAMARELVSIAEEEKGQHEVSVANAFMAEAEKHASMAGDK